MIALPSQKQQYFYTNLFELRVLIYAFSINFQLSKNNLDNKILCKQKKVFIKKLQSQKSLKQCQFHRYHQEYIVWNFTQNFEQQLMQAINKVNNQVSSFIAKIQTKKIQQITEIIAESLRKEVITRLQKNQVMKKFNNNGIFLQSNRKNSKNFCILEVNKPSIITVSSQLWLKINRSYAIISKQTCFTKIKNIYREQANLAQASQKIIEYFSNKIVRQNFAKGTSWKVTKVILSCNLERESSQWLKGQTILEYYRKQFGITVFNTRQPLFIGQKKGKKRKLIPELLIEHAQFQDLQQQDSIQINNILRNKLACQKHRNQQFISKMQENLSTHKFIEMGSTHSNQCFNIEQFTKCKQKNHKHGHEDIKQYKFDQEKLIMFLYSKQALDVFVERVKNKIQTKNLKFRVKSNKIKQFSIVNLFNHMQSLLKEKPNLFVIIGPKLSKKHYQALKYLRNQDGTKIISQYLKENKVLTNRQNVFAIQNSILDQILAKIGIVTHKYLNQQIDLLITISAQFINLDESQTEKAILLTFIAEISEKESDRYFISKIVPQSQAHLLIIHQVLTIIKYYNDKYCQKIQRILLVQDFYCYHTLNSQLVGQYFINNGFQISIVYYRFQHTQQFYPNQTKNKWLKVALKGQKQFEQFYLLNCGYHFKKKIKHLVFAIVLKNPRIQQASIIEALIQLHGKNLMYPNCIILSRKFLKSQLKCRQKQKISVSLQKSEICTTPYFL